MAVLLGATLLYASQDLPPFADPGTPVQTHPVTETYLHDSQEDIGIPNTVTAVLASYRGYDTLGELIVVFTAGITVPLLLMRTRRRDKEERERREAAETVLSEYRVLRVTSKVMLPFILMLAFYVLFHGDYGPGGGFQAGVIFASGFVLYGLVFGIRGVERVVPWRALLTLLPVGVLLYAGLGVVNMALGGSFLDYGTLVPHHPEHGEHYGILIIETGVGITVAAVLIAVFYSFASRGSSRDGTASGDGAASRDG
ncbi:Na(+)/H(+) antiporter subunit B, partial [Actinomadura adrarensis]